MVAAPGQPYVSPSRRVWRREGFQSHADSRAGGALTEITSPCREERPTPQPTPSGEGLQKLQAFYQSRVSLDILSKTIDWVLCPRHFHALLGAPYRKFEDPSACFVASRGSLLGGQGEAIVWGRERDQVSKVSIACNPADMTSISSRRAVRRLLSRSIPIHSHRNTLHPRSKTV